jgi:hypothetical protein
VSAHSPLFKCGLYEGQLLTNLIELDGVEVGAQLSKRRLGGLAVRAVGFAEHSDGVVVDDALGFGLCGGHCAWACGAREELA